MINMFVLKGNHISAMLIFKSEIIKEPRCAPQPRSGNELVIFHYFNRILKETFLFLTCFSYVLKAVCSLENGNVISNPGIYLLNSN